jgi:PPM family protein phosphatase
MELLVAAATHVGRVRTENEDSYYADANADRGLFVVADGMGGHAAGEVASAMVVEIVSREIDIRDDIAIESVPQRVADAIRHANSAVYERTLKETEKQGMGTTASVLYLSAGRYTIGQVGDSRVYLLRSNVFQQLTRDHSYVQEQVDAGFLTAAQARVHPYSNVITRCVGASSNVEPDVTTGSLMPGDIFLLASDGLTAMLEDERIHQLLQARARPSRVVDALVHEANARGGHDNVTVILVQIAGDTPPQFATHPTPAFGLTPIEE